MARGFQAVYFRDVTGREPVADFVDALPPKARAAIKNQLGRLNLLDEDRPHLPFPHGSQLRGEIRELRCHIGRQHVRVLYARSEKLLVLLHAFVKATARTPASEIEVAEIRFADFKARMDQVPRGNPRAVGHDAP